MYPEAEQLDQWQWLVRRKGSAAKPLTVVHATYQGAMLLGARDLSARGNLCTIEDVECRAVNVEDLERAATARGRAA
jgi:hypothetical protein